MARKLKTYRTSIGFFDLAVAAPSMKAALEIWGADSNLFHQGFAKETDDPAVVAATVARPGIVLRRPVGTAGAFRETSGLPKALVGAEAGKTPESRPARPAKAAKTHDAPARKAAEGFDRERRKREEARRHEEAAEAKKRERRSTRIAKAQAAIDAAEAEHDERTAAFEAERENIQKRADAEERRWETRREQLREALHRIKQDE
jgi:colicin import membrane protein